MLSNWVSQLACPYDAVPVHSRIVALQERRRAHVAHQTALSTIKKAGKARHARVDNATPRTLQFAHIRADGLERRREKEEEARHAEDPWIQHRLRQAAQVGSSAGPGACVQKSAKHG